MHALDLIHSPAPNIQDGNWRAISSARIAESPLCARRRRDTSSKDPTVLTTDTVSLRGVPRIFGGGGGVPRYAKQTNKPNKRATELKPLTCAHQGSMFRPYILYSVCFVESSIFTTLV